MSARHLTLAQYRDETVNQPLRWLLRADGTRVLQIYVHVQGRDAQLQGYARYEWQDVPILVEEPTPESPAMLPACPHCLLVECRCESEAA